MRVLLVVAVATGCGRFGFEERTVDACTGTACDEPAADAAGDAANILTQDGSGNCFGTGLVNNLCFAQIPSAPLTFSTQTINTAVIDAANCTLIVNQNNATLCVVIAGTITVPPGAIVSATGPNPLVLIAATDLVVAGTVRVASLRGGITGAGSNGVCAAGIDGTDGLGISGGGGGAGGSLGGAGANGGTGNPGGTRGTAAAATVPTVLRGGCSGGRGGGGGGTMGRGSGGAGGGAVYLIAGSSITISGGINASGAGGSPGTGGTNATGGGGGGGSGGMIGLDAPSITSTGSVFANGGGAGGGGGDAVAFSGQPGTNPATATEAALGGNGGNNGGGDGGAGATRASAPAVGGNGGNATCGGGGGGGGNGVIRVFQVPAATLGGAVSPAPT